MGAGTARSRKLIVDSEPPPAVTGFNGAGTARSRKCAPVCESFPVESMLQWGRDRAVPEILRVWPASMSAPALRRGLYRAVPVAGQICASAISRVSTGPGPRGPGNANSARQQPCLQLASMGPAPRGPGNHAGSPLPVSYGSTGPGPRGPGNDHSPPYISRNARASMGPGPRGPGNAKTAVKAAKAKKLQWGRDRGPREIFSMRPEHRS